MCKKHLDQMPREIHHAAGRQKFLGPKVRRKALDAKVDAIGYPSSILGNQCYSNWKPAWDHGHLPLFFEREPNMNKHAIFNGRGSISRK